MQKPALLRSSKSAPAQYSGLGTYILKGSLMKRFANFPPAAHVIYAVCAAWALASTPAHSAPANAPTAAECVAPSTQKVMAECAYEDFLKANVQYADSNRQYAGRLTGNQRDLFRRSQSAWLAYRTATCKFESSALRGGSAQAMSNWQCASRMTRARAIEVQNLLNCKEGELSCPRFNR